METKEGNESTEKNSLKHLPFLYPIINLDTCQDPSGFLTAMIETGLELFQIRCTTLSDRVFLDQALILVERARSLSPGVKIIINNRIDICQLTSADGVHLGQNDLDPKLARELLGSKAIIGFSTHSIEQVMAAQTTPVTYLGFGPIYSSPTKHDHAKPTGPEDLRKAVRMTNLPIVAIGGITSNKAREIYASGTQSIAAIQELEESSNLALTVSCFRECYRECYRDAVF